MNFDSVAIIGGGESGIGAALLAKSKGKKVFLSEFGALKGNFRIELEKYNIPFEEKGHTFEILKDFDVIVKSPGVPDTIDLIMKLKALGKSIISEIEFGYYYCEQPIIGITGSNGKTTTTLLTHHLLSSAGVNALAGGNLGKSFARLVFENRTCDVYVLELSSFQLDGVKEFKADIAILLNITPDHLDRYDYRFENYIHSKLSITQNQIEDDLFIYNNDDLSILKYFDDKHSPQRLIKIGKEKYETTLLTTVSGEKFEIDNKNLKGKHNRFNALCAIAAVKAYGLTSIQIRAGLKTFVNVPHRLESVAKIEGVEFINDSKATNVDAVFYALDAMDSKVVWIVGGKDKGNDYGPLMNLVKSKVKYLICLGKDNSKLKKVFGEMFDEIFDTKSTREAVNKAYEAAESGDSVLLSPACASFDLFDNYEQRGNIFKEEVQKLKKKIQG